MGAGGKLAALSAFFERWRDQLESRALVRFEVGTPSQAVLTASAKAEAFAGPSGFKPIGFNWEMLDPGEDLSAPRSARKAIVDALTTDLVDYKMRWISDETALRFAGDFLAPFDPSTLWVVTNHLNGLWYPISGASDEWSFAAMDDDVIALLVLVPRS
ncbi:MAG: hypothetical protein AAFY19_06620 [Pseudomonadota bacterium]